MVMPSRRSVVEDPQVSGHDLVLQDGSRGDVDLNIQLYYFPAKKMEKNMAHVISVVCDDDDCPLEGDVLAEVDVPGDGQVVQVDYVGDGGKALQEVAHLIKIISNKNSFGVFLFGVLFYLFEVLLSQLDERG